MLHSANQEDELEQNPVRQSKISLMEGEEQQNTSFMATEFQKLGCISLRTVPISVENGSKSLIINSLLDDGSTQTYLNADIAAKLVLNKEIRKSQVNAINGTVATFERAPVELTLRSMNGQVNTVIEAFTINHVTDDLKTVNWGAINRNWDPLRGVNFPLVNRRSKIDMLIGVYYPDCHFSIKNIRGKPGQPIARLTPRGLTCIGNPNNTRSNWHQNQYTRTYFSSTNGEFGKIGDNIRKLWDVEDISGKVGKKMMSSEDKMALKMIEKSVKHDGQRHEVAIPWKKNTDTSLLNNYGHEEKRNQRCKIYKETIDQYLTKEYINR